MKAYRFSFPLLVASLLVLAVTSTGCLTRLLRPTSYLDSTQVLVTSTKLKGIDKQYTETVYAYVQNDIRPNSFFNLFTYNLLNTSHGKYKEKIKNIGDAPHLLDSDLVEKSRAEIEEYLHSKGFFKAKVKADVAIKKKKAAITFTAERGPVFRFRKFNWEIPDTVVRRIYEENREKITRIHEGKRWDADSIQFEIDTVYALLRRKGYYDYLRMYGHMDVDTALGTSQADLTLTIANPDGLNAHPVYRIDSTLFTIDNSEGIRDVEPKKKTIDGQHYFTDYSRRLKPAYIDRYLFFNRSELFNTDKVTLTTDRLYDLNIFRSLKVDFEKTSDSTQRLNARISAVSSKRMSNRIEGEYTFNSGRNGFNIGNTYTNKNLFGGAEQLNVKFRYGILFDSQAGAFSSVFNRDLQAGVSLVLPRLAVPFGIPLISRNGLPHTTFSSGIQVFDQRSAFKNRIFTNSFTYDWVETKFKLHSLTPLNFEYRDGKFDPAFKDSLISRGLELYIRTNERSYLNLGTQYSYTYNLARLNSQSNFSYFKFSADLAGNTIALISSSLSLQKIDGTRTIFGQRYLQYAKGEFDWRLYRLLGPDKQFVVRFAPGIGIPYGNSQEQGLPFEKNFYGGGSNSIRAWQARYLGPGQYNRASVPDELTRRNFRGLDQLGEIRLEGNFEYRWLLVRNFFGSKVKGAVFTDYGNIWRLREKDAAANPGGVFHFDTFAKQIAIGAGAGMRFDLDYFVFRFDVGAKIRDPQFVDDSYGVNPWVIGKIFDRRELKRTYAITNKPDKYRFLQYNFGIGMPF